MLTCIITGELYLSLAYFYFKKYQLENFYGPSQISLLVIQFIGMISIGINYYINKYTSGSESFLFYMDNQKYYRFLYLFSEIISIFLFILTTIIVLIRKRKDNIYNELNEIKN